MKLKYRTPDGAIQMTLARPLMRHREQIAVNQNAASLMELVPEYDVELRSVLADAEWAFDQIRDKLVWAFTLSGGKDSAGTVLSGIEYLKRHPEVRPVVLLLHVDTLMEAPPMEVFARHLMDMIKADCEKHGIRCEIRILEPSVENDFWVMCLGYGYPPFSHRFRPCTDRIKIKPQIAALEIVAKEYVGEGQTPGEVAALILGVRTAESDARREGLQKVCNLTDGECGQILDAPEHLPGVTTVAPIINAKTCHVWDLNLLIFPALGWPVDQLAEICGDEVVRFGCWMCPLVRRVRDVENLVQVPENQWMEHLLRFREDYLREADLDENRIHAPLQTATKSNSRNIRNAELGARRGMQLTFRRRWLDRLLATQTQTQHQLIRPEAVEYIRHLWGIEETTGRRGKSGRAAT